MGFGKEKDEAIEEIVEMKTPKELAIEELKSWAEVLEVDGENEYFENVIDELLMAVVKEKLKFDKDTEVFTYQLLKPINSKSIIEIHETTFKEKKRINNIKDDKIAERASLMMSKHTNLSPVEVDELKTRDQNRLTAVIKGFLS